MSNDNSINDLIDSITGVKNNNQTDMKHKQTNLESNFDKMKLNERKTAENCNKECYDEDEYHSFSEEETNEEENKQKQEDGGVTNENKPTIIDEDVLKLAESKLSDEEKEQRVQTSSRLKGEGNESFKAGKWEESVELYSEALVASMFSQEDLRSIIFSNRAAAYINLDKKQEGLEDLDKALKLNPVYTRARLRRAHLNEQMDRLEESLEDYKVLLEADPSLNEARAACVRLPERIRVKTEKMKEEVFGKLKDLGNVVLKPFGLSTDNFKVQQDPTTGSYSINMQK